MEKSDKKSIIIACIFLVILFACLGFVTYIKMTYDVKDNNINNNTTIDTPVLLSLDNIIASFNNSQLVSDYYALGTTVAMEKTNTGFNVTYSSDQENDVIGGTYVEYILSIKFNKIFNLIGNFYLIKKKKIDTSFLKYAFECNDI